MSDESNSNGQSEQEEQTQKEKLALAESYDKVADPNAPKWQYLGVNFRYERLSDVMTGFNQLGAKGWELIIATNSMGLGVALFKRPIKRNVRAM